MCFDPVITWSTAGLGLLTCLVAKRKKKAASFYFAPAYFGFMEVLQGLMYTQLGEPPNLFMKILVYIAYMHVCFQPLVFNHWLGSFVAPDKKSIHTFVLKLCAVGGVFMLWRVFNTVPLCPEYEALCSSAPKVYYGHHHIVWSLPLLAPGWKYATPSIFLHMFLFFVPGSVVGLFRLCAVFFVLGPILSAYITPNVSEQPAIWCVIGLWLLAVTVWTSFSKLPKFLVPADARRDPGGSRDGNKSRSSKSSSI
jgi:hypothetical protein